MDAGAAGIDNGSMGHSDRDERSGSQWLRAISAYLEYRTGDAWRRLSDPSQRWDPERLWYLNGIRAIHSIGCGPLPHGVRSTSNIDLGEIPRLSPSLKKPPAVASPGRIQAARRRRGARVA